MYAKLINCFSKIATVLQQTKHRQLNVSTPLMWSHTKIHLFLSGTHTSSESNWTAFVLGCRMRHIPIPQPLDPLSEGLSAGGLSARAAVTPEDWHWATSNSSSLQKSLKITFGCHHSQIILKGWWAFFFGVLFFGKSLLWQIRMATAKYLVHLI